MNAISNPNPSAPQSALIYGRLSKGDEALASHEQRNRDYAAYQKFTVLGTYEDEDTSGGIALVDRPQGRALLNRLKHGDIRHLVVAKLDRLGRHARDVLATIEELDRLAVTLHIVDFGGDTITTTGHMGKLILTVFAGIAEWERSEIRDRTQKKADYKFNRGELIGNVPFGFDCVYTFHDGHTATRAAVFPALELAVQVQAHGPCLRKQLVANPAEQQWIHRIAALKPTATYAAVAAHLNAAGVRTKTGGTWQSGQVDSLLKSRATAMVLQTPALAEAA